MQPPVAESPLERLGDLPTVAQERESLHPPMESR
jgi:hypothetical protein